MYRVQVRNGGREMELYFILLFYLFFPPETLNTDTQWLYKWVPALSVFYPFMLQYNGWLPFQPITWICWTSSSDMDSIMGTLNLLQFLEASHKCSLTPLWLGLEEATLLLQKNCWMCWHKKKKEKKKCQVHQGTISFSWWVRHIQWTSYLLYFRFLYLPVHPNSRPTSVKPLCAFHICNEAQVSLALENNERVNKWVAPPAG